jgi:ubiquinone/menaquinone biosynthesis C-methylase UbiE
MVFIMYKEIDMTKIQSEEEFRKYIKQNFDHADKDWTIGTLRGKRISDILMKYNFDFENGIVLDLGSGFGGISLFFARKSKRLLSLDINKKLLTVTHKRLKFLNQTNNHTMVGNAVTIPLKAQSLDLTCVIGTLEWVPCSDSNSNPEDLQFETLRELWRILKKDGKLLLAIENRYYLGYWLGRKDHHSGLRFVPILPRGLANIVSETIRGEPYLNWTHSYSHLSSMLERAGFKILSVYMGIPSYTFPKELVDINDKVEIGKKLESVEQGTWNGTLWKIINNLGLMKLLGGNFFFLCSKQ